MFQHSTKTIYIYRYHISVQQRPTIIPATTNTTRTTFPLPRQRPLTCWKWPSCLKPCPAICPTSRPVECCWPSSTSTCRSTTLRNERPWSMLTTTKFVVFTWHMWPCGGGVGGFTHIYFIGPWVWWYPYLLHRTW